MKMIYLKLFIFGKCSIKGITLGDLDKLSNVVISNNKLIKENTND